MADVTYCTPDDLGRVLAEDLEQHVEGQRRMLAEGLAYIKDEIREQAPRLTGAFADSVQPYIGEPGPTWKRGGGGTDVDPHAMMEDWQPDQYVGVATDAPYSRKLVFHAGDKTGEQYAQTDRRRRVRRGQAKRTFTKKVNAGWVEDIVEEANRRMEAE